MLSTEHSEKVRLAGPTHFSLERQGCSLMCPSPGHLLGEAALGAQVRRQPSPFDGAPALAHPSGSQGGEKGLNHPTVHSTLHVSERHHWTYPTPVPSSVARVDGSLLTGHYPRPAC